MGLFDSLFGNNSKDTQNPRGWSKLDESTVKIFTSSQREDWINTLRVSRDLGKVISFEDEYELFQRWSTRDFVAGGAQVRMGNIDFYSNDIALTSSQYDGKNFGTLIGLMCRKNAIEAKLFEVEKANNQAMGGL